MAIRTAQMVATNRMKFVQKISAKKFEVYGNARTNLYVLSKKMFAIHSGHLFAMMTDLMTQSFATNFAGRRTWNMTADKDINLTQNTFSLRVFSDMLVSLSILTKKSSQCYIKINLCFRVRLPLGRPRVLRDHFVI
jgi:hypothetical protein